MLFRSEKGSGAQGGNRQGEERLFFFRRGRGRAVMRCSSLGASGSLDDNYRTQIVGVIPPLSFYISRDIISPSFDELDLGNSNSQFYFTQQSIFVRETNLRIAMYMYI